MAFDPSSQMVFSSNGVGTLSVIHEDSPDQFRVVDTVVTKRGARTIALDPKTHVIYLVTGEFLPVAQNEKKPKAKPGSVVLLVVGK
ncbi:MAG: YncE family protein, partial [Acidobacteriota bacterium]|nr:YncE family protein [Acidobacteriota bacterium]